MRITTSITQRSILKSLQDSYARLALYQRQASTGRRINLPSDDPVGIYRVFGLSKSLSEIKQYKSNIDNVLDEMNILSHIQSNIQERLYTIKEISVRASSGLNDPNVLASYVPLVESIIKELVDFGNTVISGKYIFSGFQTNTPAFTPVYLGGFIDSVTYNGDTGQRAIEISLGRTQVINLAGQGDAAVDGLFVKDGTAPLPLSIFDILIQLRNSLSSGDYQNIMNITSPRLSEYVNYLQSSIGKTGTEIQGVTLFKDTYGFEQLFKENLLAEVEGIDALEAFSNLSNQQVVYQTALNVASRFTQMSMFDFLR